ncbi:piwi-like protein 1 [Ixodes scapularis]
MEEEFLGCGRGGRGALLLAALQKQTRRPGTGGSGDSSGDATSPSEESRPASGLALPSGTSTSVSSPSGPSPSPAPPVGAGRGALLERLMLQSRASTSSSSSGEIPSPTAPLSSKPVAGRGLLTALGRSIAHTPAGRGVLSRLQPPTAAVGRPEEPTAPPPVAAPPSPLEPPVEEMQELTVRQYRGKAGKQVSVEVNYVRLETAPGMGVFEYHVNFVPVIDSKKARFQLVRSDPVVERIGCIRVFDGAKLYLPHQLPDKVTSVVAPLPTDGTPVTVQVKFVKVTPPSQCVHLYNVLFKKVMHCLQLTQIGRNYFDHKGKILIPQHKLEVWPGYVQSVGEFEGGLLLNCDASFRVLRTVTARDVLYDVFNAYRQEYKTKALQAIVGNIVLTRYNNKTYRVDDISWDLKPTSTFTYHTGEEIAYMDYYKCSRASSFVGVEGHPNCVGPLKKPYHTLMPVMITETHSCDWVANIGSLGGYAQPHAILQVLLGMMELGLNPQEAVERPRFMIGDGPSVHPDSAIDLEDGLSPEVIQGLEERGHRLGCTLRGARRRNMGSAHVITRGSWWRRVRGPASYAEGRDVFLWFGSDPRGDAAAMAY